MTTHRYKNRQDAGQQLALHLKQYKNAKKTLVLALPRGGVPVAHEVAHALNLPLDVYIVRKLGVPWHAELAMGALAPNRVTYLNQPLIKSLHVSATELNEVIKSEQQELERREAVYRAGKKPIVIKNQTIILIDDGIATGATMKAAIESIRIQNPKKLVCAVPVAASDSIIDLQTQVDKLICPLQPDDLDAVGQWYEEFLQTGDEEVTSILRLYKF